MKEFYIYILANTYQEIQIGVTSNLSSYLLRVKSGQIEGRIKRHKIDRLVYFEKNRTILEAIRKEKKLRKLSQESKIRFVSHLNPGWLDLGKNVTTSNITLS